METLSNDSLFLVHFMLTIYSQAKKYNEAIPKLRKFIQQDPKHVAAHYELGKAYEALAKPDSAILFYKKTSDLMNVIFITTDLRYIEFSEATKNCSVITKASCAREYLTGRIAKVNQQKASATNSQTAKPISKYVGKYWDEKNDGYIMLNEDGTFAHHWHSNEPNPANSGKWEFINGKIRWYVGNDKSKYEDLKISGFTIYATETKIYTKETEINASSTQGSNISIGKFKNLPTGIEKDNSCCGYYFDNENLENYIYVTNCQNGCVAWIKISDLILKFSQCNSIGDKETYCDSNYEIIIESITNNSNSDDNMSGATNKQKLTIVRKADKVSRTIIVWGYFLPC